MPSATANLKWLPRPSEEPPSRACPACGSSCLRIYADAPEPKFDAASVGASRTVFSHGRILQCRSCRHGFRESQPSFAELAGAYARMDVEIYEAENESRRRTAARHASLLRRKAQGRHLLDIGCASGLFLEHASLAGWHVRGIEPNAELAAKAANRLGPGVVLENTLEEAQVAPHSFDAITLWDVLEHVADPSGILARCARLLRPSGTLLLKVPDLDSLTARLMRTRWPVLLPEHLNYFTRGSLRALAGRTGLRVTGFFRRPVTFSLEFVLYRMSRHAIPGAAAGHRMLRNTGIGRMLLPLYLGELYATLQSTSAEPAGGSIS